jgi:soluble lytic murein transglycosylase
MRRGLAYALCAALLFAAPVRSQIQSPPTSAPETRIAAPSVLQASDIETYRAIFNAQDAGQFGKADTLIKKLEDESLLGYVLEQRYLAKQYKTKYAELSSWLGKYGDHFGADQIQKLALKKKPKKSKAPAAPIPARWRGERFDAEALVDLALESMRAERMIVQLKSLAREDKPEAAEAAIKSLTPAPDLPQSDIDRLGSYVAAAYLAQGLDEEALRMAGDLILRNAATAPLAHWTAGLASYRLQRFGTAAAHFEAISNSGTASSRSFAGGAFWAARAWMRAGQPERVVQLYARAASQPTTFYGMLAARLLGEDVGLTFTDPKLDPVSLASLMQSASVRRAVALWQVGQKTPVEKELSRAFGESAPELDPAFAALARALGVPAIELRAAEMSAHRNIYLTSLYPIPSYAPQGGFRLDQAMVLAFVRQESRFDADALSSAGARGLMQLMPATAAQLSRDPSLMKDGDRLDDPAYSMSLGQDHIRDLLTRQNGNLLSLAAAYNAGPGNLSRWMEGLEGNNDPLVFIESIPAAETRDYVKRVMMNLWMYRKLLGESADGLDETAAGAWPTYRETSNIRAAQ